MTSGPELPADRGLSGLIGHAARSRLAVGEADTAAALGSGDVPVLGTPRVVALAEAATVAVVADRLPNGDTTVGTRVRLDHLAATAVGRSVEAEARLTGVEGVRLTFTFTVRQDDRVVAEGVVDRVVVNRDRFVAKAAL
jgi:fluoroacetyl-CoA thioesterase